MKKGFYIGLLFCICSCTSDSTPDGVFLGGQIINPSSEKVSLYKNNKLLDPDQAQLEATRPLLGAQKKPRSKVDRCRGISVCRFGRH